MSLNLIVLACSSRKAWGKKAPVLQGSLLPAEEAYIGTIFKYGRQYAKQNNHDFIILSAHYGILQPTDLIQNYNTKLTKRTDALAIRSKFAPVIQQLFDTYPGIEMIGGNPHYRLVFSGFDDFKFSYIKSIGCGDLSSKLKNAVENKTKI